MIDRGDAAATDHVLVNDDLEANAAGLQYARIAADFPESDRNSPLTATRVSDHDPLVAAFVINHAPTAAPGGPYSAAEGGSVALDAKGSSDPDGTAVTYTWDLDGDGTFGEVGLGAARGDETGATPLFSAAGLDGPQTVTVSLRASDGELTDTETVAVGVTNVAPLAAVTENAPAQPTDHARSVTLTATDPAPADQDGAFTWSVDWGDGQSDSVIGTTPRTVSHTYAAPGTYQVAVTARDDDGATSAVATQPITVATTAAATPAPTPTPSTQPEPPPPLCRSGRALQLVEATVTGRRVRLRGIALPALAGREFTIQQHSNRAVVARGTVAADGTFTATAPVPDTGGRPRFRAVIGTAASSSIALTRALRTTTTSSATGTRVKVIVSGRVPAGARLKIVRELSCTQAVTVRRLALPRSGRKTFTLARPGRGEPLAFYRILTTVDGHPTYSLPVVVRAR